LADSPGVTPNKSLPVDIEEVMIDVLLIALLYNIVQNEPDE
jgi:hypothetical protein